jgi:pimeloyl-ACP methyl ester carboxylesterase
MSLPIDGHDVFTLEAGTGEVVLLLHGGMDHSDGMWNTFADLADTHRVLAFDRSGHGRSLRRLPDGADYSYAAMVEQTVAVLEAALDRVDNGRSANGRGADRGSRRGAHLVGHSDGGNIALIVAIERPDLVGSITTFGANYHHRGVDPSVMDPSERPHNEQHAHTMRMWLTSPTLTVADLGRISCPALIAVGENEPILWDHTRSMANAIQKSRLWRVEGADHDLPIDARFATIVRDTVRDHLAEA